MSCVFEENVNVLPINRSLDVCSITIRRRLTGGCKCQASSSFCCSFMLNE